MLSQEQREAVVKQAKKELLEFKIENLNINIEICDIGISAATTGNDKAALEKYTTNKARFTEELDIAQTELSAISN